MATALGTYNFSDQDNFFRMNILIIEFALKVLEDILQEELTKKYPNLFHPGTGLLCGVLGDATVQAKLLRLSPKLFNHHQRNQLYPAGNPSTSVTVADLDITLTVLLLRNITTLNPRPGLNAWDNPSDADTSREAKIGRVKRYRNIYGNANKAAISDQDFRAHFTELKSILLSLSGKFTNEDYDAILSKPLDAELFKKLRYYEKYVNEIMKPGFEEISQVQPELKKQVEDVQTTKDFREQFLKLCASGKIPVYRQRVAVVGPYGVGKTHLVKRLIQEKYDENNDANTPGVKIYRHRCIVHKADRSCWIRGKDNPEDQFVQNMAIGIQKPETFGDPVKMDRATSLESLTHVEKRRRMMANRASPTGDSGSYTSPGRAAAATPGDSGSHASPVQTLDYLKNIDPKLLGKIEKLARKEHVDPEKQVTIWDFGGQDVYYTTHQTFLSEHIIYLLVFRLDVDLDEKIPVYRGEKTVKEFIMFWLNSIHMHTVERLREEDRDVIPYVLIIGTHKDMLGPQVNVKDIFGKLMECLDDKQALKAHVYEYIAINNLAESDAEFDEIKSVIEKLCGYSSGTEASVHKFSVSSIQLEMDLAKKSEESPIITVDELCKMAQRVGLSDEELRNSFIPYHHHQGDILHFKVDGLENVVIIDPLWLADVFSAIMTPCISEDECSHIGLQKAGLKKGVLQEEVFDECLEENSMTERKADIIRLMLHFDLMLEISQSVENPLPGPGKRTFLVPSMLVSNKCENNAISEKDPEKCLLIAFPHILFPTGLFHQLTTRLLRKYKPLDYENNIPVVGFDRASFFLDKQSVLHLAIEENAMKMTITDAHTGSQTKPHIYSNARKTVEKELSALRDAYCPRMQLQFRIRVKVGDKDIPIDAEDVQKNDVIYKCIEGSEKPIDMTPYRVWFSEANVPDASISAQKFARLHYLVTELGTKAIRTFFLKDVVRPDLTNANHVSDKDAVIRFFSKHETKLKEAKKCMNASQLNLLNSASGQADVERFDITLLVLLLSKFQPDKDNLDWITPDQNATLPFPPQTTQDFVYHILRLKKVRNYLSHSPKYGVQDNAEFCTNRDIAYASILALGADPKEVEKTQKIMFTVEEIDSV